MDQSPHSPNFQWMSNPFGLGHRPRSPTAGSNTHAAEATSDAFDLQHLAAPFVTRPTSDSRGSSTASLNADLDSIGTVAEVLSVIIARPTLHTFLANSLDDDLPP